MDSSCGFSFGVEPSIVKLAHSRIASKAGKGILLHLRQRSLILAATDAAKKINRRLARIGDMT